MVDFRYCPVCATVLREDLIGHMRRQVCPACHFILFRNPEVVAVVVLYAGERLLLGRRAIEPARGAWSFFGGYVERGEKVEDAAVREVREECGLAVSLEDFIGLYSQTGDPHILAVYAASVPADQLATPQADHDEVSELALFALAALPPLAFPIDQQILRDWQKRKASSPTEKGNFS